MNRPLDEQLGLGERELVSVVGAGGKTTILSTLGRELGSRGARVILTTTTRMARHQVTEPICWSEDTGEVSDMLTDGIPLFVLGGTVPGKVTGLPPTVVDALYVETCADYVIVEADGARSLLIKAPLAHEPVIPSLSTTVVAVASAGAIGRRIVDVAYRPERLADLCGLDVNDLLTVEAAAEVLTHLDGGLKAVPANARVVIVVTQTALAAGRDVEELASILDAHPRVDRAICLGATTQA